MAEDWNPFQSPAAPTSDPRPLFSDRLRRSDGVPFASGHARSMFARSLLALVAIMDLFGIWAILTQRGLLDVAVGAATNPHEVIVADIRIIGTVALFGEIAGLGAAIAFLMWSHRVYRNLPALGATNLLSSPGWMVGWYFVPIANLFRPYRLMAETWRFSDPWQYGRARKTTSGLVAIWWATLLSTIFVNAFAAASLMNGVAESFQESLRRTTDLAIASYSVEFTAAIFAILLVYWIDRNQQETYNLITIQNRRLPATVSNAERITDAEANSDGPSAFRMTEERNPFV